MIIVWRLDRWGRSLSDLTESLEDLRAIGLDFVSPGRAIAGMLAIFAQFERDVLRERVCAGLAHAKAKGKTLGRAATAGVKSDKIRTLFSQDLNKNQIVRRLHIGRGSVFRVLNANGHESQ